MKKRSWKQFLAGLLAAAVTATSVPPMAVQAAPSQDTVQEYDYAKLYSLEEGRTGDYIAGYYKDMGEEPRREMNYGEMTYLEFALSYNTPVKMELYIRGEAVPVGFVYGLSYDGHVNKTGGAVPIYTAKPDMKQTQIRNEMAALSRTGIYKAMSACPGISLTGLTASYGTLAEYYAYYGIEAPGVMSDEAESEEPGQEDEVLKDADTVEPEKGNSTQSKGEVSESEEDSKQTKLEEEPERTDEETPEQEAPAMNEKDVPLVQSALEETGKTEKKETDGNSEARVEEETAEEPPEQESGEKDSEKDASTEKEPVEEAPAEDVLENKDGQEQENTAEEDILLSDPEGLKEEDYPEDFFIPYPEYGISTLSDEAEELPEGILHNYLIWKGQFVTAPGGIPQYAPPGEYEIRITPTMASLSKHTASIFFTIKGSGASGEVTEEDIQRILQREREFFPGESSGFPALVTLKSGDPVDLLSGALNWSYQDLLVEGKEPLNFTRTYVSSMRNRDISGLGNGWTHPYSYFADMYRHDISVYMPGGGVINYQKIYGGGFQTTEGNEYALIETGDGGFILSSDRGKTITFNSDGRATRVEESNGVVTTLEYSGD